MNTNQLSVKEKISYGLGDTGCNFVWQTVMLFMSYFYTDIYGLSPAHMGTMFLVVRVVDAVADVFTGAFADRTRTRFGQFRPYILIFAIPFGAVCMFTFYTPDLSYTGKLIYAYGSYTLLSLIYTAINVPYCALINNLSNDSRERVSIQSYRFALSGLAGLIVSATALPLVNYLGQGNMQSGYFKTMLIMSCVSIVLFFICFSNTRERYIPDLPKKGTTSVLGDFKYLLANNDWRIMVSVNVINLLSCVFKVGATIYYANNVLGKPALATVLLTCIALSGILGALMAAKIFKNVDRVKGFNIAVGVQTVALFVMFFIPSNLFYIIIGLVALVSFTQNLCAPLQWSMLSDVTDLEEKRSGRRLSGMVFSTNLFAIKLGIALGGAILGWFLAFNGYVGGSEIQPAGAVKAINMIYTIIPSVLMVFVVGLMQFYSLNDEKVAKLKNDDQSIFHPDVSEKELLKSN
jgi:GPH family glycoside/pentoside/hexuronide:cation symporter